MRSVPPALGVLIALSALAPSPAYAGPNSWEHSHDGAEVLWVVAALLALGGLAALGARRAGKAAIVSLAVLLGLFGLEAAVHSVHHLGDSAGAESCAVSSTLEHVPVASGETLDVGAPMGWAVSAAVADTASPRSLRAFRFHEGRAPPLPSA